MYDKSATRRKSPELIELETLFNAEAIRNNRDTDFRFVRPRSFKDHNDSELIFSILAYLGLLGGTGNKSQVFRGVEAVYHGFSLKIIVDVDQRGKPSFTEKREAIEMTVHSFAQAKNFIDQL